VLVLRVLGQPPVDLVGVVLALVADDLDRHVGPARLDRAEGTALAHPDPELAAGGADDDDPLQHPELADALDEVLVQSRVGTDVAVGKQSARVDPVEGCGVGHAVSLSW